MKKREYGDFIQMAICNLKQTKFIVSILNSLGSISNDDAQEINDSIQIQINNLNASI